MMTLIRNSFASWILRMKIVISRLHQAKENCAKLLTQVLNQLPSCWFTKLARACMGCCLTGCLNNRLENIRVAYFEASGLRGKIDHERGRTYTTELETLTKWEYVTKRVIVRKTESERLKCSHIGVNHK